MTSIQVSYMYHKLRDLKEKGKDVDSSGELSIPWMTVKGKIVLKGKRSCLF